MPHDTRSCWTADRGARLAPGSTIRITRATCITSSAPPTRVRLYGLWRPEFVAGHARRPLLQEDEILRESHLLRGQPSEVLGFCPAHPSRRLHGRPNRDYGHNYDTVNAAYANQVNDRLNIQLKTGFRNYDRRWGDDNYPVSLALVDHAGVQQKIVPTDLTLNLKHHGESAFTVGADRSTPATGPTRRRTRPRTTGNDATIAEHGPLSAGEVCHRQMGVAGGGRLNHIIRHLQPYQRRSSGVSDKSWTKFLWSAGARYNFSKKLAAFPMWERVSSRRPQSLSAAR